MRSETKLILVVVVVGYATFILGGLAVGMVIFDSGEDQPDHADMHMEPTDDVEDQLPSDFSFTDISADVGINYTGVSTPGLRGTQSMMGDAGVYTTDYNENGLTDVLLIGGEEPILFENTGGTFEETDAIPAVDGIVRTALFYDHHGDGTDDLLLLRMNDTPVFFENDGGEFTETEVGYDNDLDLPIGATAGDYTGDGCLDVFVIQNGDWFNDRPAGLQDYNVSPGEDNGNPNVLFKNDCSEVEVATDAGITGERWSLATSFVDLTGNGYADIHVANDFNRDIIYLNNQDGTFERVELGDRTNRNGMSSAVGDVTGNGYPDLFVTNVWYPDWVQERIDATSMQIRSEGNNLLLNAGDGTFEEAAGEYGVEPGGWGWAATVTDLTNDGNIDIFHTTRHMTFRTADRRFDEDEIDELHRTYHFYQRPVLFQGTADGFEERRTSQLGFAIHDSRGVAEFDATGDGSIDLLVADNAGSFALYENTGSTGNALLIDVEDHNGGTAIGAKVEVVTSDESHVRFLTSSTDYLSQSWRTIHAGVGDETVVEVEVTWPDGTTHRFDDVQTEQRITVDPSGGIEEEPLNDE